MIVWLAIKQLEPCSWASIAAGSMWPNNSSEWSDSKDSLCSLDAWQQPHSPVWNMWGQSVPMGLFMLVSKSKTNKIKALKIPLAEKKKFNHTSLL